MVTTVSSDLQKLHETSGNVLQRSMHLTAYIPPLPKSHAHHLSPTSLEQFLGATELPSLGLSPHIAQINLTDNCHIMQLF